MVILWATRIRGYPNVTPTIFQGSRSLQMRGAPSTGGFGPWRWEGWVGGYRDILNPLSPILRIVAIGGLALELEVNLYVSREEGMG